MGGRKTTTLTSADIRINICINAVSVVPSGNNMDVRRENTDVRLVGFHPPHLHWRRFRDNAGDSDSHYLLALATLGVAP
jgi:hypothetical protein